MEGLAALRETPVPRPDAARRANTVKYVIIGGTGQLGRDLAPRLGGTVLAWGRAQADLTQPELLRAALAAERPDVVLNCAAYNLVNQAETEPEPAFAVNAFGVRDLARICAELDLTLVHFSTDYVFGLDATRQRPYREDDTPGPVNVYGVSKLEGEYAVRTLCPKHFVIRTCGLYGVWGTGGKGGNFVETMFRLAGQGKKLTVVNDQRCTPSYTVDVALATVALLPTARYGLYHLTNAGSCTWFEFAREIFRQAGVTVDLSPIATADRNDPARRPAYSVLDCAAYDALGLKPMRPWQEALAAYLEERKKSPLSLL
jgi:dTDP-4-dehydrorhamnose reductase